MNVRIAPSKAVGTVAAPPSKSMAHRLLICAALAEGESRIRGVSFSEDISATIDCLRALGADIVIEGDSVTLSGGITPEKDALLPCRECGSTLRFLIPVCLTFGVPCRFTGSRVLFSRPLSVYEDIARSQNLPFLRDEASLSVCGVLSPGEYTVPGNISSQFISGLLFALPLLPGGGRVTVKPPFESRPYVDMTVAAMRRFGVPVTEEADTFFVPAGSAYRPCDMTVEGDYSNAAFLSALNLSGGSVRVTGLSPDSLQGDRVYITHMEALKKGFCTVDISDCPDLGPILFVCAALLSGATFTGTKRLAIKESDRARAMAEELSKCGVATEVSENSVTVRPGRLTPPASALCGHNDHRIVMALSVLLTALGGEIAGAEAVTKSFPDFFDTLRALGVELS